MNGAPSVLTATNRAHFVAFMGALLACVAVVLWMVGPYLLSLFLGGTMAMLAYPVQRWFRERRCGPRTAAAAVTALAFLLVVAPLTGFSVMAVRQGIALGREMSELKEFSPRALTAALSRWELVRAAVGDPASIKIKLAGAIQAAGQFTSGSVVRLGKGLPEFMLQMFLASIAFFFFLLDGERFMGWLLGLGVLDRGVQEELVESFRDTMISAVLAGLAAAAAQAALIAAGFLVLGVPGAFLAGGVTFIFAWIPMLGTIPASAAGLLYLYSQGTPVETALMVALALSSGVVDNLVRPFVLKGRADMHPLVGFVSIVGGIQLFGMLGVFIGPVLAALLLALIKIWPSTARGLGIVPSALPR